MRFLLALLLLCGLLPTHALLAQSPPRAMLATRYQAGLDVGDYWISEKLDGVRARWDGRRLLTRSGQPITPPEGFTRGWPLQPMDGELWLGRGRFDHVSALVRSGARDPHAWREVRFMLFDLPDHGGNFDARVQAMKALTASTRRQSLLAVPQFRLSDEAQLQARLSHVVDEGGEGLMLHRGTARYQLGRSDDLLKLKAHDDAEARVVAHVPGKGKYTGMLGALLVRLDDGRQFRLGSGFTDAQRAAPPPIGSLVTFRYEGLTSKGLPRFARFLRLRSDPPPPDPR